MDLSATASCENPIFDLFNFRVVFLSSIRDPVPLPRQLLEELLWLPLLLPLRLDVLLESNDACKRGNTAVDA
jgi:hypothetical protein